MKPLTLVHVTTPTGPEFYALVASTGESSKIKDRELVHLVRLPDENTDRLQFVMVYREWVREVPMTLIIKEGQWKLE